MNVIDQLIRFFRSHSPRDLYYYYVSHEALAYHVTQRLSDDYLVDQDLLLQLCRERMGKAIDTLREYEAATFDAVMEGGLYEQSPAEICAKFKSRCGYPAGPHPEVDAFCDTLVHREIQKMFDNPMWIDDVAIKKARTVVASCGVVQVEDVDKEVEEASCVYTKCREEVTDKCSAFEALSIGVRGSTFNFETCIQTHKEEFAIAQQNIVQLAGADTMDTAALCAVAEKADTIKAQIDALEKLAEAQKKKEVAVSKAAAAKKQVSRKRALQDYVDELTELNKRRKEIVSALNKELEEEEE